MLGSGRPVPVLNLEVPAWPSEAGEAEILIWFSPQPIDEQASDVRGERIRLDEIGRDESRRFQFPDRLPGVAFDVSVKELDDGRCEVKVVEKHEDARGLPALRVRIDPACERAEHVVDETVGEVRHVFEVLLEQGRVPPDTSLSIVHRDDLKRHCVPPNSTAGRVDPLVVPVPLKD